MAGIQDAAQQVQAMGRGPDTMLAHISPDEAKFIDQIQGGRRTNPHTGLPEYGMFGNILKAVARAAAAAGGFMIAGPAGAAAASGVATKLTGGSWKDALSSAALSGIGGELGQGLTHGGWSPIGTNNLAAGAAPTIGSASSSELLSAAPNSLALGPKTFFDVAKSAPGLAAGAGALMGSPINQPAAAPPMPAAPTSSIHLNDIQAQPRSFIPYEGDPNHFAEPGSGGQGHVFYSPLNPLPKYKTPDDQLPLQLAAGGPALGVSGPDLGMRGLRGGGISMPGQPGGTLQIGAPGIGVHTPELRQAALLGYQMAAKGGAINAQAPNGGPVRGPGGPTEDAIPALLSAGEHIVDEGTVRLAGGGSNERGQKVMEQIKQGIRAKAGVENPKKPPAFQGAERAKRRAGVK